MNRSPRMFGRSLCLLLIIWKPLNLRDHPHGVTLQVHLPLHLWYQAQIGTSPGIPGEPNIGLDQDANQLLTPITPMPRSGHTLRRGMNYQVCGGSFIPFTTEVQGPSVRQKYKSWPANRQQLSSYQSPRMRSMAGGMLHMASQGSDGEISSLHHLLRFRAPEMSMWWGTMRWWPWPMPSSGVPYGWELLWEYFVTPSKTCTGVLCLHGKG